MNLIEQYDKLQSKDPFLIELEREQVNIRRRLNRIEITRKLLIWTTRILIAVGTICWFLGNIFPNLPYLKILTGAGIGVMAVDAWIYQGIKYEKEKI